MTFLRARVSSATSTLADKEVTSIAKINTTKRLIRNQRHTCVDQTFNALSYEPEATYLPSGLKVTEHTSSWCLVSDMMQLPRSSSHNLTDVSYDALGTKEWNHMMVNWGKRMHVDVLCMKILGEFKQQRRWRQENVTAQLWLFCDNPINLVPRVSVPTTKGGREERPWKRGWWDCHKIVTTAPWRFPDVTFVVA